MKKLIHHSVFIVSVLVAYLINGLVIKVLGGVDKLQQNKYVSVLITMTVVVIVFYPISRLISMIGENVGQSVIKQSQKSMGNPFIGWLLGMIILLLVLFCCYAWKLYDITVVTMVKALF